MASDSTATIKSLEKSPRILIVRKSAIGDVIHGIPVLCALREALPDSFLAWVVEGHMGDVLEGHPALDALIRVPRRWWKSPSEVWRGRQRLRELNFDITIDLQCLTKSAITAWLSGAPRRIGKAGADGRELSKSFNNELVEARGNHVVEHYLSMLRVLGIESPAVRFELPAFAEDGQAADKMLRDCGLLGRRFAVVNPGAGWPSKIWPAVRYAAVARHLGREYDMPTLAVWGTKNEIPLAQRIVEYGARHVRMAPPTTMRQLAAICRRAALFVGSDTGPMHLAVAVGTPSISLHGPSRAEWCGAYGPQNIRLQVRYEDGSSLERRKASDSAMQEITSKMVTDACDRLLAQQASRRAG
jgi:heptosyltransferase I